MDTEFQTTFQRVETALQRLTDSIAAYNPSTTAAEELVEADADVAEKVAKCKTAMITHCGHMY